MEAVAFCLEECTSTLMYHNCTFSGLAVLLDTDNRTLSASAVLGCTDTVRMGHMLRDTVLNPSHWSPHCPFCSPLYILVCIVYIKRAHVKQTRQGEAASISHLRYDVQVQLCHFAVLTTRFFSVSGSILKITCFRPLVTLTRRA